MCTAGFLEEDKNRWFADVQGIILNRNNKGIAVDDVMVINPTFLLNMRYGLTYQDFRNAVSAMGLTRLARFSQNLVTDSSRAGNVSARGSAFPAVGTEESGDGRRPRPRTIWWRHTKISGNHNMVEFRVYRENANRFPTMASRIWFQRHLTRGPLNVRQTRSWVAMWRSCMEFHRSMARIASYAEQDTYTSLSSTTTGTTSTLTLNLGVRYELETPITERYNRAVTGYDVSQLSPCMPRRWPITRHKQTGLRGALRL